MQHLLDIPADKIAFVKQMCEHLGIPIQTVRDRGEVQSTGVNLTRIMEETAGVFGVTVEAMTSKSQDHELVRARWVCFVIAYAHLEMSNKAIGHAFNRRDPSTVINGKVQAEILIQTKSHFREQAVSVERLLFPEAPSAFEAFA